jgi:hypothetical protein
MEAGDMLFSTHIILKCLELAAMNNIQVLKWLADTEEQIVPFYPAPFADDLVELRYIALI